MLAFGEEYPCHSFTNGNSCVVDIGEGAGEVMRFGFSAVLFPARLRLRSPVTQLKSTNKQVNKLQQYWKSLVFT